MAIGTAGAMVAAVTEAIVVRVVQGTRIQRNVMKKGQTGKRK
jgi:hypothetical protein